MIRYALLLLHSILFALWLYALVERLRAPDAPPAEAPPAVRVQAIATSRVTGLWLFWPNGREHDEASVSAQVWNGVPCLSYWRSTRGGDAPDVLFWWDGALRRQHGHPLRHQQLWPAGDGKCLFGVFRPARP